jgi:hypothetical protein
VATEHPTLVADLTPRTLRRPTPENLQLNDRSPVELIANPTRAQLTSAARPDRPRALWFSASYRNSIESRTRRDATPPSQQPQPTRERL